MRMTCRWGVPCWQPSSSILKPLQEAHGNTKCGVRSKDQGETKEEKKEPSCFNPDYSRRIPKRGALKKLLRPVCHNSSDLLTAANMAAEEAILPLNVLSFLSCQISQRTSMMIDFKALLNSSLAHGCGDFSGLLVVLPCIWV